MEHTISINGDKCINCNKCVAICPAEIFITSTTKTPSTEHIEKCIECGHCVAMCPTDAIYHSSFGTDKVHKIDFLNLPQPSQLLELIKARRSNRVFTKKSIPIETLKLIIEAGHRAPTATNAQQVNFTLVTSPQKLHEIGLFTINTFGSMIKKLKNPLLKPIIKMIFGAEVFKYAPIFEQMEKEFAEGNDKILRGATAVIFIHTPIYSTFGREDANLAYQNSSLMAESLGIAQFYTGFVCSASSKTGNKKLAKILGIEGHIVHAGMALGVPKHTFTKYIDKKDVVINYL